MVKNFIQKLYESEIQNTELALATESFSDEIQSIIEKVTNLKTKELAELVKKIKYDGDIEKADSFNTEMSQNLDTIIQAATEAKSKIDNNVVSLFQGQDVNGMDSADNMGGDDLGSIEDDFGGDDFEEFSEDDFSDESDEDLDLSDIDFGEVEREKK